MVTEIIFFIILIPSIILHEVAHGYVADFLGDPTARLKGRLTLNPIPHIDPFGSIILPLVLIFSNAGVLFGWAKPVPIEVYNLKNPQKDSAIIALSGPLTNILITVIAVILFRLLFFFSNNTTSQFIQYILGTVVQVNLSLAFFNLLPISPLDGFKIVGGILSERRAREWYGLERYGMIFVLLLVIPIGNSSAVQVILRPIMSFALHILLG